MKGKKAAQYLSSYFHEPYEWIMNRYINSGGIVGGGGGPAVVAFMLKHKDAVHPAALFSSVVANQTPTKKFALQVLESLQTPRWSDSNKSMPPAWLEDARHLKNNVLRCTQLKNDKEVLNTLSVSLLHMSKFEDAVNCLGILSDGQVEEHTWRMFVAAVCKREVAELDLVSRLVGSLTTGDKEPNFSPQKFTLPPQCAAALLNPNWYSSTGASLDIALAVLERYFNYLKIKGEDSGWKTILGGSDKSSDPVTPFLLFLAILRKAKDSSSPELPLPWEIVWRLVQMFNTWCPKWLDQQLMTAPAQATTACQYIVEVLASGANPWLTLNVARVMAARRVADGVEIGLWLLQHIAASHHRQEANEVAVKLFDWLLNTVGIHLHQRLQRHVLPAVRALIRLDLHSEIAKLHGAIVDNVLELSDKFREEINTALVDLVCPVCATLLEDSNIFSDRTCKVCCYVILAKEPAAKPSYVPTAEQLEAARIERQLKSEQVAAELRSSISRLRQEVGGDVDAALLLERSLQREDEFEDSSSSLLLFQNTNESASQRSSPKNIRAALDIPAAKLQLQKSAKDFVGASFSSSSNVLVTLPSILPRNNGRATNLKLQEEAKFLQIGTSYLSAWSCVWCQQENSPSQTVRNCVACGAETGPAVEWRKFEFGKNPNEVMKEIRSRIERALNGSEVDALIAAYKLMLCRKSFLLRATRTDHEYVQHLIARLALLEERALCGFLFMRLVPATLRESYQFSGTLQSLAMLFGQSTAPFPLAESDLASDSVVFAKVFGEETCNVCYGTHMWKLCPIVTRDFSRDHLSNPLSMQSLSLTNDQRTALKLERIRKAVAAAVDGTHSAVDGFNVFLAATVEQRELFARQHHELANCLSQLLTKYPTQSRQAAFVLTTIPVAHRTKASYLALAPRFNVSNERCLSALKEGNMSMHDVLNLCCICFKGSHDARGCDKFAKWFELMTVVNNEANGGDGAKDTHKHSQLQKQATAWIESGTERLQSFASFLLSRAGEINDLAVLPRKGGASLSLTQLKFSLNLCIVKCLQSTDDTTTKIGRRLLTRLALPCVTKDTLAVVMTAGGADASAVDAMRAASTSLMKHAGPYVLPRGVCLICCGKGHGFKACPEVASEREKQPPVVLQQLQKTVEELVSIRSNESGVLAAANYVIHAFQVRKVTLQMLVNSEKRQQPIGIGDTLVKLVHRCFAWHRTREGGLLLRRLPLQVVARHLDVCENLWKSAGLDENQIAAQMHSLKRAIDGQNIDTPSEHLLSKVKKITVGALCPHCFSAAHTVSECDLFKDEAAFGRDIIAVFRVTVASEHFTPEECRRTLLRIAHFIIRFKMHLPFHILGVQRAANALCAMLGMLGEKEASLRLLFAIPACYRMRHIFVHVLIALGIPKDDAMKRLASFRVVGERNEGYPSPENENEQPSRKSEITHLVNFKSPIADVAMKELFADIPYIRQLLAGSDRVILSACSLGAAEVDAAADGGGGIIGCEQHADIAVVRDRFDAIQREVEERVKMKLGSRHVIYSQEVELLGPA